METVVEIISSLLVLVGIIVTIVHFNKSQLNQLNIVEKQIDAQRKENKEINLNNFQTSFWTKQLELYIKTCSYAAQLTQHDYSSEAYKKAKKEFYIQYWGPMSIVEDKPVKGAMKEFSKQLKVYEKSQTKENLAELEQTSYRLARTCRESSKNRWELQEFELD